MAIKLLVIKLDKGYWLMGKVDPKEKGEGSLDKRGWW